MANWWDHYPWRNIQTNLRERDMEDMDAKAYVARLKELGATVTLLNAAGIVANYDTKLDFQPKNPYLRGNTLEEMVEECHRAGIRVFCRTDFSRIRRDIYEKHPNWAFRTAEGKIVDWEGYVSTCLNGDYQRIYMHEVLREVLTKIPFDGIFFNMGGFMVTDYDVKYYGACHCENCRRMYRERFGEEMPEQMKPGDPSMLRYMAFKDQCEREHRERVVKTIREISPQIAIHGVDYIRSESGSDAVRPPWPYSASSNARRGSGPARMRLADNNAVDFMGFRYRHTSVSPELMELRQWQNLANSGNVSVFIMGDISTHPDRTWYAPTKKVFDFHREHEELYTRMVSDAKVALAVSHGVETNKETQGWVRALTQSHIPFDEIYTDEMDHPDRLEGKEVLILGDVAVLSDGEAEIIDRFAEKGGTVLVTGKAGMMREDYTPRRGFALRCLGVTVTGKPQSLKSSLFEIGKDEEEIFPRSALAHYIAPGDTLMTVRPKEGAKGWLSMIGEHPYGPPEICYIDDSDRTDAPGVIEMAYGKGKSVYIPFAVGNFYAKEGHKNSLSLMQDVLFGICGIEEIAPDLSPMVELVLCRTEKEKIIQLINESGCMEKHYMAPLPVYDLSVRIPDRLADGSRITNCHTLRGGKVSLERDGDDLVLHLNQLCDYEAIVVS